MAMVCGIRPIVIGFGARTQTHIWQRVIFRWNDLIDLSCFFSSTIISFWVSSWWWPATLRSVRPFFSLVFYLHNIMLRQKFTQFSISWIECVPHTASRLFKWELSDHRSHNSNVTYIDYTCRCVVFVSFLIIIENNKMNNFWLYANG